MMRATNPLRLQRAAPVPVSRPPFGNWRGDDSAPDPGLPTTVANPPVSRPAVRMVATAAVLALTWGTLTDWRVASWVFGAPAVVLGATVGLLLPASPRWRISPRGALGFALWFALQSVRGAVDVARRALSPRMPLRPDFRRYRVTLPSGAPQVLFVNAVTLLPGTLAADIEHGEVTVHMLDSRNDLDADLGRLELQVRKLFAIPSHVEL